MADLTRYILWLYVFTLSWDNVPLPLTGSISRATGLAVAGTAIVTTLMRGRFRRPDAVLGFAVAFGAWSVLSMLWTISYGLTSTRAYTYVQVVASAWLIREFVRTRGQMERLITAFCFGAFVPLASLLKNFWVGNGTMDSGRFSGSDLNPNTLGMLLVIALPMAWHLLVQRRGIVRIVGIIYCVLTPLCLLLTATRGGFVAGLVALAIVPLTLPRSVKWYAAAGLLATVAAILAMSLAPRANWDRILSISTEVTEGGRMSGRKEIWAAGWQVYPERPVVGFGAGAFGVAVQPYLPYRRPINSHNTAIGLLVEEGIVGLSLFAAVLAACAWTIVHMPRPYRGLWGVLMSTWLVAAMDGNFEYVKVTWMLFGLLSAQNSQKSIVGQELQLAAIRQPSSVIARLRYLGPAESEVRSVQPLNEAGPLFR